MDDAEEEVSFGVSEAEGIFNGDAESGRTVCRGLIDSSVLRSFGFRQPAGAS